MDVKNFPLKKSDLATFGKEDISTLCDHYGIVKSCSHPKSLRINRADPKISKNDTLVEYELFKTTMFDFNAQRTRCIKENIEKIL